MSAPTDHVVECFWPGVAPADLDDLDRRARETVASLDREGVHVTYGGSWLLREDEVVLCFFSGSRTNVTEAARRAAIPFERIHEGVHLAGASGPAAAIDRPDPDGPRPRGPVPGG